jgi:cellulose synthase/poly-beta-1,6-N-acetylglucosamine synthase-like glycosyltransferase
MISVIIIFWILGTLSFIGGVASIVSWIHIGWKYKKMSLNSFSPKVCIIIPCKDIDEDFKGNVDAFLKQDYEHYKIVFVVHSTSDPAFSKLKKLTGNNPRVNIEVSREMQDMNSYSEKIANLLKGVKVSADVDVYVFGDSDLRPHKEWLRYLISPLNKKNVGAATGYRYYFAHDFLSLLLSSWNAATTQGLFYDKLNFVSGGSTAVKRTVFEELNIAKAWRKSFSDDLILSEIIKKHGYKIKFIPKCIIECHEQKSIPELIKWTTGQFTWIKYYHPFVWVQLLISNIGFRILNFLGIILLIMGYTIPGLLMLSPIFLDVIRGWIQFSTLKNLMYYPKEKFYSTLAHAGIRPLASFLISYNLLTTLFKKEIKWGGRIYRLD